MTMTIDHARAIVEALANGEDVHPPVLQREVNQAFAVMLRAAIVEPTHDELVSGFQRVLERATRIGL